VRVLLTTLLFTCGGMGLGLLLGIIGRVTYGLIAGVQPDMRNAYRLFAIPLAAFVGCVAFAGLYVSLKNKSIQLMEICSPGYQRRGDPLRLPMETPPPGSQFTLHGCTLDHSLLRGAVSGLPVRVRYGLFSLSILDCQWNLSNFRSDSALP
jgi:hypothetical protein